MTKTKRRLRNLFKCKQCHSSYIYTTKKEHICRRCGFRWSNEKPINK